MSDEEPTEIVIIRRRHGGDEDGHHGGVWKIAFADFMTAMMAFFLVLWIVNSTSKETRSSVARYFNPVKLSETSPARKGLQDPKESDFDASADKGKPPEKEEKKEKDKESKKEAESKKEEAKKEPDSKKDLVEGRKPSPAASPNHDKASAGEMQKQSGVARPAPASPTAVSEAEAIDDPMSLLDEIAGKMEGPQPFERAVGTEFRTAPPALQDKLNFRDPFEPISPVAVQRKSGPSEGLRGDSATRNAEQAQRNAESPQRSAKLDESAPVADPVPPVPASAGATAQTTQQAARLRQAINNAMRQDPLGKDTPLIDVTADAEGILISLTDSAKFSMFSSASAVPEGSTVKLMTQIGQKLRDMKGTIVIRGHTDSRPFKPGASDNWRLSSSRAQMAFYMLVRAGVDEKRIERVEGYADRRPRNAKDTAAAENRRIEIMIRPDQRT